jgi:hypothetical protein
MVAWKSSSCGAILLGLIVPGLLGAKSESSPLQEMDGDTKGRMMLALAGLLILWLALIALAWLGARFVRRRNARRLVEQKPVGSWYDKPVVPRDDDRPSV